MTTTRLLLILVLLAGHAHGATIVHGPGATVPLNSHCVFWLRDGTDGNQDWSDGSTYAATLTPTSPDVAHLKNSATQKKFGAVSTYVDHTSTPVRIITDPTGSAAIYDMDGTDYTIMFWAYVTSAAAWTMTPNRTIDEFVSGTGKISFFCQVWDSGNNRQRWFLDNNGTGGGTYDPIQAGVAGNSGSNSRWECLLWYKRAGSWNLVNNFDDTSIMKIESTVTPSNPLAYAKGDVGLCLFEPTGTAPVGTMYIDHIVVIRGYSPTWMKAKGATVFNRP